MRNRKNPQRVPIVPRSWPVFTNPIHMAVKPASVHVADYPPRWKVAHGYISGRPSSQKRGSWVCLLAPFQKVSENRLHKPHKPNDQVISIWLFRNVYLRIQKAHDTEATAVAQKTPKPDGVYPDRSMLLTLETCIGPR
jgi:hypothetical protein